MANFQVILLCFLVVGIFLIILPAVMASECDDHFDNDGDGYCDFLSRSGYCEYGDYLGDINCLTPDGSESASMCTPSSEVCDSIDNDCDGLIDENLTETQNCGSNVGECEYGTEARTCVMGEWGTWSSCTGGIVPAQEICGNGKDENCDGVVDDGCPGNPPTCIPFSEVCDGVDNDCDGQVDEGCYVCGNSIIETGEECDSSAIVQSCRDAGFGGGFMACYSNCTYDKSRCIFETPSPAQPNATEDNQSSGGYIGGQWVPCNPAADEHCNATSTVQFPLTFSGNEKLIIVAILLVFLVVALVSFLRSN